MDAAPIEANVYQKWFRIGAGGGGGTAVRAVAVSRPQGRMSRGFKQQGSSFGSRGRSRGGGGQRQPRGRGAAVSQDDLDKDLDSYMATD